MSPCTLQAHTPDHAPDGKISRLIVSGNGANGCPNPSKSANDTRPNSLLHTVGPRLFIYRSRCSSSRHACNVCSPSLTGRPGFDLTGSRRRNILHVSIACPRHQALARPACLGDCTRPLADLAVLQIAHSCFSSTNLFVGPPGLSSLAAPVSRSCATILVCFAGCIYVLRPSRLLQPTCSPGPCPHTSRPLSHTPILYARLHAALPFAAHPRIPPTSFRGILDSKAPKSRRLLLFTPLLLFANLPSNLAHTALQRHNV